MVEQFKKKNQTITIILIALEYESGIIIICAKNALNIESGNDQQTRIKRFFYWCFYNLFISVMHKILILEQTLTTVASDDLAFSVASYALLCGLVCPLRSMLANSWPIRSTVTILVLVLCLDTVSDYLSAGEWFSDDIDQEVSQGPGKPLSQDCESIT